jgi:hypothetical protein
MRIKALFRSSESFNWSINSCFINPEVSTVFRTAHHQSYTANPDESNSHPVSSRVVFSNENPHF